MRNHTKGPWHVSGVMADSGAHLHIGAKNSAMVLASLNHHHTDAVANAELIAASPEMLEVLENLLCLARHRGTAMLDAEDFCEIERVVKKAKGDCK